MNVNDVLTIEDISAFLLGILKKYHAEKAMVFGSYARREASPDSDIDVIIFGGSQFIPTDIFAIAEELHEKFDKPVDVYEIREINQGTAFYQSIMSEGVMVA